MLSAKLAALSNPPIVRTHILRVAGVAFLVAVPVLVSCGDDLVDFELNLDPFGCPPAPEKGAVHGKRSDERLDLTAERAWPRRAPEPPPLTAPEVARACAIYAACVDTNRMGNENDSALDYIEQAGCYQGAVQFFTTNAEERAILLEGKNERWSFFLRAVLDTGGDCMAVRSALSDRNERMRCEEDGCWWQDEPPKVSCDGSVAVLRHGDAVTRRDCARSYTECDSSSPTGCTDRPLLRCSSDTLLDRCDGTVRLGCDRCGLVAFRDCSWNGGTCVETQDGAHCEDPENTCGDIAIGCDGTRYRTCVFGQPVEVDCADFNMVCAEHPSEASATTGAIAGGRCVPAVSGDGTE